MFHSIQAAPNGLLLALQYDQQEFINVNEKYTGPSLIRTASLCPPPAAGGGAAEVGGIRIIEVAENGVFDRYVHWPDIPKSGSH